MSLPPLTPPPAAVTLAQWPLAQRLAGCRHVLLAGAGGGFDVYSAVPLLAMLEPHARVSLANLSFTNLAQTSSAKMNDVCWQVNAGDDGPDYFPERTLARWLQRQGTPRPVHAFSRTGVEPLRHAYRQLIAELGVDGVVLVDGGTDSLLRGHESDLGTPIEDVTSIAALHNLDGLPRMLCAIGFGVDSHHGVAHAEVLAAVADYARHGGFLGVSALLPGMAETDALLDAVAHANLTHPQASIVANSVASAAQGHFGDHHAIDRTRGNELWVNPLMAVYWAFELDVVASRNHYLPAIAHTATVQETVAALYAYRDTVAIPARPNIPH